MSKRVKYSAEEKYEILKAYESGAKSMSEIVSIYGISKDAFRSWRYKFEKYGIDGLRESTTCKRYTKELKEQAIKDYLSGKYSPREIARRYEISNKEILIAWVKKYNGHREMKTRVKGINQSMTKGRATSLKERIEIVMYCIRNGKDYQHTAEVYNVSYQQTRKWVIKYELDGEDALNDRRGRKKVQEELTPEERMKLQIKKLELENERLRAENEFLKKLDELERGRY